MKLDNACTKTIVGIRKPIRGRQISDNAVFNFWRPGRVQRSTNKIIINAEAKKTGKGRTNDVQRAFEAEGQTTIKPNESR